ncbi:hypothetical protein BGZ76_011806 [Entomortierella beljakovae]|nr:hypothetical protein BGZ76_011806 [Entomortierella beljakovae]
MLQSATIASSTPVTAETTLTTTTTMTTTTVTTPRTPKQNRKSAITISLQNQNNSNTTGNTATNNNGRQKRNPAHTHTRHQSLPAQSRPSLNNPPVPSPVDGNKSNNSNTTGKRSSASPASSPAVSGIQILKYQQGVTKQTNNPNTNNNNNDGQRINQKNRSSGQAQSNNNNNKNKRNQRRKDTDVTADSKTEMDTAGDSSGSPSLNPSTPPSTDSDDSESAKVEMNPRSRPLKGQNNRQNGRSKGYPQLSGSPPQRPNSAPVVPQPRKGIATPQKQNTSGVVNQRQQQGNFVRKTSFGSASSLPAEGTDSQLLPNMSKGISVDEIMAANRLAAEKKSAALYAGPTFHNSPDPTALPIPAFARPFEVTTESHVEKLPQPFFGEAALPQLNSMRPQRTQSETSGWMAHQSMPGMTPYQMNAHQLNLGWTYQLTERMVTSSYTTDGPLMRGEDQLMEITQSLRSILKIQSQ